MSTRKLDIIICIGPRGYPPAVAVPLDEPPPEYSVAAHLPSYEQAELSKGRHNLLLLFGASDHIGQVRSPDGVLGFLYENCSLIYFILFVNVYIFIFSRQIV